MYEPEQLLSSAIEQVQVAAAQIKQQYSMEAKMWQKKAQELQSVVDSLQAKLQDAQKENAQLRLALDEKSNESDRLRTMNASLTRTLQEKDQAIAKYVSLNQSLKGLLDEQPEPPPRPAPSQTSFQFSQYETPVSKPPYVKPQLSRPPPPSDQLGTRSPVQESPSARPASQGSVFIRAAKSELTYSDFNQMISEINMYNKHQQSREETIANVKKLLCPAHRALFDQFLPMIGGN